jgi:hypothetical protein
MKGMSFSINGIKQDKKQQKNARIDQLFCRHIGELSGHPS